MASSIQLLRSTNPQERPFAGNLLEGQPAANLHSSEPGLFFKTTDGSVVKFGPAAITSDGSPPNSTPQGSAGNSVGELWLDKSFNPPVLRVYDGAQWVDAGSGGGGGGGGSGSFLRWIYVASGGETSLSGTSGGVLLAYTAGLEEVFINGVLITRGTDYSAINGTSITNLAPLTAGDVVTVLSMNPLETVQLPGQVTLLRWTILAAAGQTVLSGVDSSSQQLAYTAGFEEVYINGAFLRRGIDYTATSGSSITISSPLAEDDEITVMAWSVVEIGSISVNTNDIVDLAVKTSKLDDEAVTTNKLEDGAVTDAKISNAAGISSSKLSYSLNGSGIVRSVESRLSDAVSVMDFIPEGTDTSTVDCTQFIQNAIDYACTLPLRERNVYFPPGNYLVTDTIDCTNTRLPGTIFRDALRLFGNTTWGTRITGQMSNNKAIIDCSGSQLFSMENLQIEGNAGVGIFTGSSTVNPQSHTQRFTNLWVSLPSDASANGGNGTVGFWNYGSEENVHIGGHYRGDYGAIFTGNSSIPFSYLSPLVPISAFHSCGVNQVLGTSFYGVLKPALYTADVNTFNYTGYLQGGNQVDGVCHRLQGGFTGSIIATYENCKTPFDLFGYVLNTDISMSVATGAPSDASISMKQGSFIRNSTVSVQYFQSIKPLIDLDINDLTVLTSSKLENSVFRANFSSDYVFNTDTSSTGNGLANLLANSSNVEFLTEDSRYFLKEDGHRVTIENLISTLPAAPSSASISIAQILAEPLGGSGSRATAGILQFEGVISNGVKSTSNSFVFTVSASLPFFTDGVTGAISLGSPVGSILDSIVQSPGDFDLSGVSLQGTVNGKEIDLTLVLNRTGSSATAVNISGGVKLFTPINGFGAFSVKNV